MERLPITLFITTVLACVFSFTIMLNLFTSNLPATVTEIGLVQCGIGDKGGDALIMWAAKALNLRWLCVEQNSFSDEMKDRFIQFGNDRKGLLVVL